MLSQLRAWLVDTLRRSQADESLDRELRSCVEIISTNKVRQGLHPAEARRQALIEIGGVGFVKEQVRGSRRGAGVESVVRDVRYAARLLRRQPLGTAAVVLTLSIGIGAVAAIVTLLNGFVFRMPVSRDPGGYFRVIRENGGGHGTASLRDYLSWRDRARSARELAGWSTLQRRASLGTSDPADVPGLLITCVGRRDLLAVLRVE